MKKATLFALLLIFAAGASVSEAWNFFDRLPVEIDLARPADLEMLVQSGIDISSLRDGKVIAYVTTEEFDALTSIGHKIEWIPMQEKDRDYPTYAELTTQLQQIAANNPDICAMSSAGQSVQLRELWWMKISDNVGMEEDEPEFKYISTMHGDEVTGVIMCLWLISYLTDYYGTDPQVTSLVDETEIWIMPLMNPDGYESSPYRSRYNAHGVDLNRDFPDFVTDPIDSTAGRAPETAAIMNWHMAGHYPILSANLHGGELVVNYPWDTIYALNPDDALFIDVSLTYSSLNPPMYASPYFDQGITRGAVWYVIHGGMQDWCYFWKGCNDVTIEISSIKEPSYAQMTTFWSNNRDAMLAYMERVHDGVRGIITDASTGSPVFAAVEVQGIDDANNHAVYSDPDVGDYHRMLLPADYTLIFSADGYLTQTVSDVAVTGSAATVLDIEMISSGTSLPPYEPASPNPIDGATDQSTSPILQWTGGDPNPGNTVTYHILVDTVDPPVFEVDSITAMATVLDLSYQLSGLDYSTLYYWQIIAEDNHGESTPGPVWSFTTGAEPNDPPYVPSSPLPADGATSQSTTPTLRWNGGDPDAGTTVSYSIYLDTVDPPAALIDTIEVPATQTQITYLPGQLVNNTTYYWKIVAEDDKGATTAGPIWHFTTLPGGGQCFAAAALDN